jgi:hypothetical protein
MGMATHISPWIVVLVLLITIALIWLSKRHDARAILQNRFPAPRAPDGPLTECEVRFPLDESPTPCMAHAGTSGLYLASSPVQVARRRWGRNTPLLQQAVLVPWPDLDYYPARFPLQGWLRLDIRGTKATFFIRETIATGLLQAAGQPIPTSKF